MFVRGSTKATPTTWPLPISEIQPVLEDFQNPFSVSVDGDCDGSGERSALSIFERIREEL